ncbi:MULTISPECIES: GNAT family N-acetyltransferase [unclassified Curtobacterium]|uniref:GNAT family N-acetyltransferase n=1 Tax=unclassified Curtobacterium TaxID=257496 RepID=UPI00226B8C8D|nr:MULTISPECIES: GNAT family N-acetyltransferase [unclassified Curtobacterium]
MGEPTAPVTVRAAVPEDAEAVAAVHVQAWQEAYAHLLPAAFLAALDPRDRVERWRRTIENPTVVVHVAEVDAAVVGWATAGPGREADAVRPLELEGIYVLAAAHGSGAGQGLLDASLGDRPAFLWVAEHNPRAEAFYRRNGFRRDGSVKVEPVGPHTITAVRMVR